MYFFLMYFFDAFFTAESPLVELRIELYAYVGLCGD